MAAPKGHKKYGGGRAKGTPNRSTADARAAIALFVDGNAHRLQGWLDQIADGVRGPYTKDDDGNDVPGDFIIPPNPEKAFTLFKEVIEYHVPKLARTELSGPNGGPVETREISDLELARRVLFDLEKAEREKPGGA